MKSEKVNWKNFFSNSRCGVKVGLLSMVIVMVMFWGLGKEARAESGVPLNVEQTYNLPQGHYVTYNIIAPADGVVNIWGYNASGDGIELSLIDENNNVILSGYKGNSNIVYLNSYGVKKGSKYYFKVSGIPYSSSSVDYVLSYKKKNFTISTPTISSSKAKGKHVKVSSWWSSKGTYDNYVLLNKIKIKMKSDCQGYTVKVAKKSNMKGSLLSRDIDVSKKNSLTLDDHFSVYKNYYMKMRGYVTTPFGERIYGKYSKVKKISLSSADYKKCK